MSNIRVSSKLHKFIFYFLQLTWGIPQNILGFLIYLYVRIKHPRALRFRFREAFVIHWKLKSSMSLGMFIFMGVEDPHILVHEYGHSIQSCILGPFYLLVIGIPSFLWANIPSMRRLRRNRHLHYSSFYPEKWANHLGRKVTHQDPLDF
ncbi:MAG: hypothetical protein IJI92_10390 [Erysipelotrichaceae bacterium]|nr:hypothetical protein [Erysipelotrichaceae bacterium]